MSLEKQPTASPQTANQEERDETPSPNRLRHRPSFRASTLNTRDNDLSRRRSSFFSEGLSDTHRSFRTSTDDLLLPRVKSSSTFDDQIETSHWHSVPLGLALLPAVGGLFFKDGSAVVTDITLLGLAAILLNWALRLPWEWYKTAQATITFDAQPQTYSPVDEEESDHYDGKNENAATKTNGDLPKARAQAYVENTDDEEIRAAQRELRLHELLALLACFVFPLLGAWLLHAIRSQLSRPSEGLVSNYNLTIFLLVAELRPMSHLIKLVQRRTLYLQRRVNTKVLEEREIEERQDLGDMARRLEELEAHVADSASRPPPQGTTSSIPPDALVAKAASQASTDLRKAFQPELDALNRAMRRYEKRMTITAIQVEARLQDLETRLKDVVVLAAAAQRNADKRPRNYLSILANWVGAMFVIPVQYLYRIISLPAKLMQIVLNWFRGILKLNRRDDARNGKGAQRSSVPRPRAAQKKGKVAAI